MARSFVAPESADDLGGESTHLEAEGIYHFLVKDVFDGYMANGKTQIKNGGIGVKLEVCHGEHVGKTVGLNFIDPNAGHKDGGKSAAVKQSAFCIATNLLTPDQINGQMVSYDEQEARGHQVVAEVRYPIEDGKKKVDDKGKSYLELHWSNIYHVDDPRTAKVDKNQAMIGLIPSQFRRLNEAYFTPIIGQRKQSETKSQAPAKPVLDTEGL
jgi:hypothetical protein